jgi:hypothetical protein
MKFWLQRGAETFELEYVLEIDGIGMVPTQPVLRSSYLQPGATLERFAVQPRHIALAFGAKYANEEAWRQFRQKLYALMRPIVNEPIVLRVQIGDETYEIDCYYNSELQLQPEPQVLSWQRCVVELLAPDPRWRSSRLSSYYVQMPPGGLGIPLAVPVTVGGDIVSELFTVNYFGTADAEPIIIAFGPLSSLSIEHKELGCVIRLLNLDMALGDVLTIDCRWGRKSVSINGVSAMEKLSGDSDLVGFRLSSGRVNNVKLIATGITRSSRVAFQFYTLYAGI